MAWEIFTTYLGAKKKKESKNPICVVLVLREIQALIKTKRKIHQYITLFFLGGRFKDDFNFILFNYIYLPSNLHQTGLLI